MYLEEGRIVGQTSLGHGQFLMEIHCPKIARATEPGQFVQVACGLDTTTDPLLRRPISIHSFDREKGSFQLYYLVVGKGTELLSKKMADQKLSVMGPLGKGFELQNATQTAVLVGGGMGVAPLLALAEELKSKGKKVISLLGAASSDVLVRAAAFNQYGDLITVTEDGSLGRKGLVTEFLPSIIENNKAIIYACGPLGMLKAVVAIAAQLDTPCQVSLEAKMACGVGACLGCTCVTSPDGGYPKVCKDGPVFWAEEVRL